MFIFVIVCVCVFNCVLCGMCCVVLYGLSRCLCACLFLRVCLERVCVFQLWCKV